MPHPRFLNNRITKRLFPLYVAAFFQGFVLWYAIEKLFMTSIGFTPATIGLMAAAYAGIMLFIETPSGILADRWSRKGVLILASIALAVSSIVCGLSTTVSMFIVGAGIWGVFYALYSGTYDSIVYDTLLEETGQSNHYERYYGRIRVMDSAALVLGSLLGGLVSANFGLQAAFVWTVPTVAISIVALLLFKKPMLHKAEAHEPLLRHIKTTLRAVIHHKSLIGILVILVLGASLSQLIFEFDQLWLLATSTPTILYGPATALLLSTIGAAGLLAPRLKLDSRRFIIVFIAVFLTAGIILITVNSSWPLIISFTIITISLLSIDIVYLRRLHDQLPSKVRSGASSAVSTTSGALFIPLALSFGWISQQASVFIAGWLILIPLALISLFLYTSATKKS